MAESSFLMWNNSKGNETQEKCVWNALLATKFQQWRGKKKPFYAIFPECSTQLNLMLLYIKILPAHNAFRKEISNVMLEKANLIFHSIWLDLLPVNFVLIYFVYWWCYFEKMGNFLCNNVLTLCVTHRKISDWKQYERNVLWFLWTCWESKSFLLI